MKNKTYNEIAEEVFKSGFTGDLHSKIASEVLDIPYERFLEKHEAGDKEARELRAKVKREMFSVLYSGLSNLKKYN